MKAFFCLFILFFITYVSWALSLITTDRINLRNQLLLFFFFIFECFSPNPRFWGRLLFTICSSTSLNGRHLLVQSSFTCFGNIISNPPKKSALFHFFFLNIYLKCSSPEGHPCIFEEHKSLPLSSSFEIPSLNGRSCVKLISFFFFFNPHSRMKAPFQLQMVTVVCLINYSATILPSRNSSTCPLFYTFSLKSEIGTFWESHCQSSFRYCLWQLHDISAPKNTLLSSRKPPGA